MCLYLQYVCVCVGLSANVDILCLCFRCILCSLCKMSHEYVFLILTIKDHLVLLCICGASSPNHISKCVYTRRILSLFNAFKERMDC